MASDALSKLVNGDGRHFFLADEFDILSCECDGVRSEEKRKK